MNSKFSYQCNDCGREIPGEGIVYLCSECAGRQKAGQPPAGILKVIYNPLLLRGLTFKKLEENRFIDLLPFNDTRSLPFLRTGNTPLYRISGRETAIRGHELFIKDDSQNPTFSFKDRASAVVSAFAKEQEISTIVAASTGNAGSSLAGMCAAQGQKAVIFAPASAPAAKLTQILMYGAVLVPVNGNYDIAFDLSIEATKHFGWYNRNTAYNPLTIEGKKTAAFEIYSQLGHRIPDRIFVPVGDGVIISGIYKGFEDMLKSGITDSMPEIVAVQAEGSSNLVDNIGKKEFNYTPSSTLADSISVDIPRNFRMAEKYLLQYKGKTLKVSDWQILEASRQLAAQTGLFAEPAAAAAYAGYLLTCATGITGKGSINVLLLTGSGLKDLKSVQPLLHIPEAVSPDIHSVTSLLKENTDLL
ncbi:threonine synthase [Lentimicrobium saccharophilum]|uniref:Threonine synthase n=1 Tax=Lentimicrobium saccharophilum TaxID=1678841 RepID=A0A0S7BQV8_9BACT|nr:threonine synthase [Lentimicrobium saccharophilum]GAP42637.1 threonine synthase [Lentimicrobium saccharophilum]